MACYKRIYLYILSAFIFIVGAVPASYGEKPGRNYYQLKVYYLKNKAQQDRVDNYLQNAYLPALHRAGIKAGIFKQAKGDTTLRFYVFIPVSSLQQLTGIDKQLQKDKQYATDGKDYLDAVYNDLPYDRIETIIMQAFEGRPQPAVPDMKTAKEDRVYELRSYEGPTEKLYASKVKMFHSGEFELFDRLGFHAVFYGEVLAGSRMPNLMYLTCFDDKASREEHWKAFFADPVWKELSPRPEFQHTVSKGVTWFLAPTNYSDF
jgi:hypothetical protein